MNRNLVEETVRTRIHALAETLPVDSAAGWDEVANRQVPTDDSVPVWRGLERPPRRRIYRRPALLGIAATVLVAAGVVGLLTLGTGPASGTPALPEPLPFTHGGHEDAVALLERAAAVRQRADSGSGPARYAKTQNYALQTDVADRVATTTVETTIREVWVKGDGSVLAKSAIQDTTRAGQPVGSPSPQSTDNNWQDINASLPNSPSAIAASLLGADATGSERDLILAQQVMAHLGQGTTTPVQTASLYNLLANLPGVFDAGTVTDNAGRTGHAVGILTGHFDAGSTCTPVTGGPPSIDATLAAAHALGQGITYLVLDPATGNPLQIEQVDTPNAPCGLRLPAQPTIEQYNVILNAGQ
jgi:hypothetical protein